MRRCTVTIVAALVCLAAFASSALGATFETNAQCLGCHDVATGSGAFTKVDFEVPGAVNYGACASCHQRYLPGYQHYHFGYGQCQNCHDGEYEFLIDPEPVDWSPFMTTAGYFPGSAFNGPLGTFATAASPGANAATLHGVHNGSNWIASANAADFEWCRRCHSATKCTTCHSGTIPHEPHAVAEYPAVPVEWASGTLSLPAAVAPSTCVNPSCHALSAAGTAAFTDPACGTCHPSNTEPHGYDTTDHVASDATIGGAACSACHALDLSTEHEKPTSSSAGLACGTCHPAPRDTVGAWDQSCVTGGCHSSGSSAPMHSGTAAAHAIVPQGEVCLGCHDGEDLGSIHALASNASGATSCFVCHTASAAPATGDCTECHFTFENHYDTAAHLSTWDLAACGGAGCHATRDLLGAHTEKNAAFGCADCHSSAVPAVAAAIEAGDTACGSCHPGVTATQGHRSVHWAAPLLQGAGGPNYSYWTGSMGTQPTGDCAGCHVSNLVDEHMGLIDAETGIAVLQPRRSDTGAPLDCRSCHASTNGAVLAAIATGQTKCDACHAVHGPINQVHVSTYAESPAVACGGCHSANIVDVHNGGYTVVTPGGASLTGCDVCHAYYEAPRGSTVQSAISTGNDTRCAACHAAEHPDLDSHSASAPASTDGCGSCHAPGSPSLDLKALHSGAAAGPCAVCHSNPARVPDISLKTAECASCHSTEGVDHHRGLPGAHAYSGMPATCGSASCHPDELLPAAHEPYLARYPQYVNTCELCHSNDDPDRVPDEATAACDSCHMVHPDPDHDAEASAECVVCHGTGDALELHALADAGPCDVCHANPARIPVLPADTECVNCHDFSPVEQNHYPVTTHVGDDGTESGVACSACHRLELWPEHSKPTSGAVTCAGCHTIAGFPAAWNGDCTTCHATRHGDTMVRHGSASVECAGSSCHAIGDVATIHADASTTVGGVEITSCGVCHRDPDTVPASTACADCHEGHGDLGVVHGATDAGDGCARCHTQRDVRSLHGGSTGCVKCHDNPSGVPVLPASVECVNCHSAERTDYHTTMDARHIGMSAGCVAVGCHANSTSLPAIHAAYVGAGREYAQYTDSCALCHVNPAENPTSAACQSCHVYGSGNPHYKMDHRATSAASQECVSCHESNRVEPVHGAYYVTSGTTDKCATCHDDPVRGDFTWTVPDSDCEGCHGEYVPASTNHFDAADHLSIDGTDSGHACSTCHRLGLNAEHSKPTVDTTCAECHETKVDGLGTWDSTCSACHSQKHAEKDALHASPSAACAGSGCHDVSDVAAVHGEPGGPGCTACHTSADQPPVTTTCTAAGCHGTFHAGKTLKHTATASGDCARCHDEDAAPGVNVEPLHVGASGGECAVCHAGSARVPDVSLKTAECASCHASSGTDYHRAMSAGHTFDGFGTGCIGAGCHVSASLPQEHARFVSRYPAYADTCALCHLNADADRIDWSTANADCSSCHTVHGDVDALHQAPTSTACTACHETPDVRLLHPACTTCHNATVNTSGSTACATSACHGAQYPTPDPAHYDSSKHVASAESGCTNCHYMDMKAEHFRSTVAVTCVQCHELKVDGLVGAWNKTCAACHPTRHGGQNASHVSGSTACGGSGCHNVSDASDIHRGVPGGGCSVCHTSISQPATTTNCTAAGCHEGASGDHEASHDGSVANGVGCEGCHFRYLTDEHQALGRTCSTCHDSANSAVNTAIATGDRRCSACHPAVNGRDYHAAQNSTEFVAGNSSVHRVTSDLPVMRSSFRVGTGTYTWTLPGASSFLKTGWTTSSIVTCDKCHTYSGTTGPHGATMRVNLDPAYPGDYQVAYLGSSGPSPSNIICSKCHTNLGNANGVHSERDHEGSSDGKCTNCHAMIPHGWRLPRLLAYTNDPAPYASRELTGLSLQSHSPNNWSEGDCSTSCGEHNSSMSGRWPSTVVTAGNLTVTVTTTGGTPLAGATVTTDKGQTGTTDASGNFSLTGIATGAYSVTASKSGYAPQTRSVTVNNNQTTTTTFALAVVTPGTLSGKVTDASGGTALSGATVQVTGDGSTTTSGNGTYSMSLMPGTYTITYSAPGYTTQTKSVTVSSGATTVQDVMLVSTPMNLALDKAASASSQYSSSYSASKAFDGSTSTYWRSSSGGSQWLRVDLGASKTFSKVIINWNGSYYARSYKVETSNDGSTWTSRYSTTSGSSGTKTHTFTAVSARYVRLSCTSAASSSYRVNEFGVWTN